VNTSQREQYGGTVHLFIGTGHNPDKITFMPLITNHDYDTNYQGLCSLFLFKSVPSFVSSVSSCRSSFSCSFGIHLHVTAACLLSCRRCFCLEDLRRRRRPPTYTIESSGLPISLPYIYIVYVLGAMGFHHCREPRPRWVRWRGRRVGW
jgi:hypothetical protein